MSRCDMFGGLPMDIQMAMKRYMGEGQGDTSGAEETSSSDSSDDEAGQMTSPVDKIIARRKKIQFQITLQQKCLDFIVKNHVSLAKDQKKQFKLMADKHSKVLDLIVDAIKPDLEIESFIFIKYPLKQHYSKEFVKLLLHKNTCVFYCELLEEEDVDENMWAFLVRRCPNLKKIIWQHSCCENLLPIKYIVQIKSLDHIQLNNFICDNSALENMAIKFPNLRFLEVKFYKINATGMQSLLKMKNLEHLIYTIKTKSTPPEKLKKYNTQLMEMCIKNLPKLKRLENHDDGEVILDIQDALGNFNRNKPNTTLKLESLCLEKSLNIPPSFLPLVETIRIVGPLKCASDLTKFKNLKKLDFDIAAAKHVEEILKVIGKQLSALRICNQFYSTDVIERDDIYFDFYTIFHYCPNLERFYMKGVKFYENSGRPISAANFGKLTHVDISLFDMQGYQMPLTIMEFILRAEKLQDLTIYWAKCFPKALMNVLGADHNRKYLQNLKRLSTQRIWVQNIKQYINQLKKVIFHAPKLQSLEIVCRGHNIDTFKRSGLKEMCSKIPGLNFLTDYDDGVGPRDPATYLEIHGFSWSLQDLKDKIASK